MIEILVFSAKKDIECVRLCYVVCGCVSRICRGGRIDKTRTRRTPFTPRSLLLRKTRQNVELHRIEMRAGNATRTIEEITKSYEYIAIESSLLPNQYTYIIASQAALKLYLASAIFYQGR